MAKILVADDDGHIRDVIRFALERAGHDVREAKDGAEAESLLHEESFDLALLDIMMPEKNGFDLVRDYRKDNDLPVIFVSSRDDELDMVLGLELGGDDYIAKPFRPRELVARVGAVLRRVLPVSSPAEASLSFAGIRLDLGEHRAFVHEQEVVLTVTEFAMLKVLVERKGRVVRRSDMVESAYGDAYALSERTVDSHIRRLRKKIAEVDSGIIETVYGVGYRLLAESDK